MEKRYSLFFIICLCLNYSTCKAQTNAIILKEETEMDVRNEESATLSRNISVKILNEKGNEYANFMEVLSKYDKLSSFYGDIKDESGKIIHKIKKSDLQTTEYSSEMATDEITTYYKFTPPTYPITVTYTWKEEISDGVLAYPAFAPQTDYDVEIKHASYRLILGKGLSCRYLSANTSEKPNKTENCDGTTSYEVNFTELRPIERQSYAPPFTDIMPIIYFAPDVFSYRGYNGNASTWKDLGLWHYNLLNGRDILSDNTKKKLHELTDTCKSIKSKITQVYKYLENTTRYVSIQLGIGGFQPAIAENVAKTGFGDCKGLSNYMMAMLKEVGVSSFFTIISTKTRHLPEKFSFQNPFNHAILQVPDMKDTLWIECTDAKLPLGYVHSGITGHDALVITTEGGTLCHLPSYKDEQNKQISKINIDLQANGSAKILINQNSYYRQYEDKAELINFDADERVKVINDMTKLPSAKWGNIEIKEDKRPFGIPELNINAKAESEQYAGISGNVMFVPISTMNKFFKIADNNDRKYNINIEYGYTDEEITTINLPEGYTPESLPQDTTIEKPYAKFFTTAVLKGKAIEIHQLLQKHHGCYPITMYQDFKNFMKQITDIYNQKIILKKK